MSDNGNTVRGRADLRWNPKSLQWYLVTSILRPLSLVEHKVTEFGAINKGMALNRAIRLLKSSPDIWEFTIFNTDGKISKGDNGKRTYGGKDPRGSKG